MTAQIPRTLDVNGATHPVTLTPLTTLLEVLRGQLGLTGAKEACGRGECGACTVLVGGRPLVACLTLATRVTEPVRTIEGLADEITDLREAFADLGAYQCGFCTPGQLVQAAAIVRDGGPADEETIRQRLSGNICRCTGYVPIVQAVQRVLAQQAAVDRSHDAETPR